MAVLASADGEQVTVFRGQRSGAVYVYVLPEGVLLPSMRTGGRHTLKLEDLQRWAPPPPAAAAEVAAETAAAVRRDG
jgi:hypothetical protein